MWRHWMSVGAAAVGMWAAWAQASLIPVERKLDAKATTEGLVDDPAQVVLGGGYGTQTMKAEVRGQQTRYMMPVDVWSTMTVTSEVQMDMIRLSLESSNVSDSFLGLHGQAEGTAEVTFDVNKTTQFRVSWDCGGLVSGGITIPVTLWTPPPGGGAPVLPNDTVDHKVIFLGGPDPWSATDVIYELGPGRHTLSLGQWDELMAGASGGGHMSVVMQVVPEPGIAGLLLMSVVGVMGRRRR